MRGALVVAIALAAGFAFSAIALGAKSDTSVELNNPEFEVYKGKVESEKARCDRKRRVTVVHDEDDDGVDPTDFVIGSDRTNRRGKFKVVGPQAPSGDTIIAVAKKKKIGRTTCKKGEGSAKAR